MKKTFFSITLLAAVAIALGACRKEPGAEEQNNKRESAPQEASAPRYWDVVGQLVAGSDITDDYKGKTFEPVIGVEDPSDPQARIVATNSRAAAAKSFANLIGVNNIDENTVSYSWSNEEIGTLTYTRLDGTTAWADVKVEIPSVPHLSKIIYRSAEQSGDNGSFEGSAYYRFGDVISRPIANGLEEYWVCVRPAFSPEGKEETHWMSIGNLPADNIWTYTSSHNKEYAFPTGLKTSKEHMQNLAEMLYALCFPEMWMMNIVQYSTVGFFGPGGLPIFHDFSKNTMGYHNAFFWSNVAHYWREKGIDQLLFGRSLDAIAGEIEGNGLHFLYKGYSWWTPTSNYATVYQARFVNTPGGVNANMQTKSPYTDQKVLMVYKDQPQKDVEFDVRNVHYVVNMPFFGDQSPRYILRYATGAELSSTGRYSDVHEPISGTKDVYRYYKDVLPVEDLVNHEPEMTDTKIVNNRNQQNISSFAGIAHYKVGSVYKDETDKLWFVVNMAGANGTLSNACELAPFTELVSFSGLSRMQQTEYISGLPTFEKAVRAVTSMHLILFNGLSEAYQPGIAMKDLPISAAVMRFLSENAGVDISRLFQVVKPVSNIPRNYTHMTAFAYSNPEVNLIGQAVGRYLYPIDLNNENPPRYFWQHYPSNPSEVNQTYDSFSRDYILLQDVADANKVRIYAPDVYATKGFHPAQATHGQTEDAREIRSQTEPQAMYPESYLYNKAKWNEFKYLTDMWNEPVLMFRVDAVYDRGDEYSTITENGHRLTLVKEFPYDYRGPVQGDELEDTKRTTIDTFYAYKSSIWIDRENMHKDNTPNYYPDWQSVWSRR